MNKMSPKRIGLLTAIAFTLTLAWSLPLPAQSASKSRLETRVKKLEGEVARLSEKQRGLEARIGILEQLNLTPSPEKLRQAYVTANKDALVAQVVNIGAHAYQYRLRPTTMGGGGGSFESYKIPKLMMSTAYGTFEATAFRDSIVIVGKSTQNLGTVQTTVDDTGRTGHWIFTDGFE